jgi:hypothetical protein
MITRGIRAFVARDWGAAREAKNLHWSERISRLGAVEGLRAAEALRQQMLALHSGWPNAESRRVDIEFHAEMAARLRRVGTASRP